MTTQERKNNDIFKEFLHNLREGQVTEEGIELLHRRTLGGEKQDFSHDSIDWLNGYYVVKRNELRMHLNNLIVIANARQANTPLYLFLADDRIQLKNGSQGMKHHPAHNKPLNIEFQTFFAKLTSQDTQNLPTALPLYHGMRVAMTRNVTGFTELGYANGAFLTVKSICVDPTAEMYATTIGTGDDALPCYVYSKPPLYITAEPQKNKPNGLSFGLGEADIEDTEMPIWPVKGSFLLIDKLKKSTNVERHNASAFKPSISRTQLPLEPACCLSVNKMQGKTGKPIICDPRRPLTGPSPCMSNYVMFSRTSDANQLVLLKGWDINDIQFNEKEKADIKIIQRFMERLQEFETKTMACYQVLHEELGL